MSLAISDAAPSGSASGTSSGSSGTASGGTVSGNAGGIDPSTIAPNDATPANLRRKFRLVRQQSAPSDGSSGGSASPSGFDTLASLFASAFVNSNGDSNPNGSVVVMPVSPTNGGSPSSLMTVLVVGAVVVGGWWWWKHRKGGAE